MTNSGSGDPTTKFECPACREVYSLAVELSHLLGKKFKCKSCYEIFVFDKSVAILTSPRNESKELRAIPRRSFQQRAVYLSERHFQFFGSVHNMSFNSALFRCCSLKHLDKISPGEVGILQIALTDLLPVDESSIYFLCEVVRKTDDAIGFVFKEDQHKLEQYSRKAKVHVKRSNGSIEGGWELCSLMHQTKGIPQSIQSSAQYFKNHGPVGVVLLRKPNEKPVYKVIPLDEIIQVQDAMMETILKECEDRTMNEEVFSK